MTSEQVNALLETMNVRAIVIAKRALEASEQTPTTGDLLEEMDAHLHQRFMHENERYTRELLER